MAQHNIFQILDYLKIALELVSILNVDILQILDYLKIALEG